MILSYCSYQFLLVILAGERLPHKFLLGLKGILRVLIKISFIALFIWRVFIQNDLCL